MSMEESRLSSETAIPIRGARGGRCGANEGFCRGAHDAEVHFAEIRWFGHRFISLKRVVGVVGDCSTDDAGGARGVEK